MIISVRYNENNRWKRNAKNKNKNKKTHVGTSNSAAKSDLASLQAEVDKIDIDKLKKVFFVI